MMSRSHQERTFKMIAAAYIANLDNFDDFVEFMSHLNIDTVEKLKDAADVHLREEDLLVNPNYRRGLDLD